MMVMMMVTMTMMMMMVMMMKMIIDDGDDDNVGYLGRLGGHLDADLQDGDGEFRVRAAAQPQPEVWVGLLHLELFNQFVQLGHPAERQVTVRQEHPVTLLETVRVSYI